MRRTARGGAERETAGPARRPGSAPAASRGLDLELDADFHQLPGRNVEVGAGALGIAVHEREQRLAPARHAGLTTGRDDGLVTGVVGHLPQIAWGDLPARQADAQALRYIDFFHEAE